MTEHNPLEPNDNMKDTPVPVSLTPEEIKALARHHLCCIRGLRSMLDVGCVSAGHQRTWAHHEQRLAPLVDNGVISDTHVRQMVDLIVPSGDWWTRSPIRRRSNR